MRSLLRIVLASAALALPCGGVPAEASILGSVTLPANALDVELDYPLAYVAATSAGLRVVDVSSAGLLAEGEMRLLPGTHVDVHLVTTDGRLLVRSRVVRAYVHRVDPHHICYRGALSFDRPVPTAVVGYPMPVASESPNEPEGNAYPQTAPEIVLTASEPSFP